MALKSVPVNPSALGGGVPDRVSRSGVQPRGDEHSESLPCLYSNNSIENSEKDASHRVEQIQALCGILSPYHRKQADRLYSNVERFITKVCPSKGHVAFFTLTFPDKVYDFREVQRRWNSLNNNYLRNHPEFGHWLSVKEQHKDGSWHLHVLIEVSQDIREGFDFEVYGKWLEDYRKTKRRKRLRTGGSYLRNLWQDLRENLQKYRFGRSELVPIRSNEQAMARYVGKYVSKHIGQREAESKGVRIVSYSQGWAKHSMNMAWHTPKAQEWRRKVSLFAQLHGCTELYQLADKLGSDWAYKYTQEIYDIESILEENGGICSTPHQDATIQRIPYRQQGRWERQKKQLTTHIHTKNRLERSKNKNRIQIDLQRYCKIVEWVYDPEQKQEVPF
jgi:hypothetical protein